MSKTTAIASIVALLAIGSALYQHLAVRRAEAAVAGMTRERDSVRDQLRAAEKALEFARRTVAAATPPNAKPGGQTPPGASNENRAAAQLADVRDKRKETETRIAELEEEMRRLRTSPEGLRAEEARYRGLYRLAGFSAAQVEQFRNLLAQNLRRRNELEIKAGAAGMSRAAGADAMEEQLAAEFIVDARSLFGESSAQIIQRYQETRPLRAVIDRLAAALFYSEAPLTSPQAEQVIELLAAQVITAPGVLDGRKLDIENAVAQAQRILSPAQLAEFRNLATDLRARRIIPGGK